MHTQPQDWAWRATFVLLFALLGQVASTRSSAAHAFDRLLRAEGVTVGEHVLTVWTSPSRLRPGEVHVDVRVTQADGSPESAAFVQVHITPVAGTAVGQGLPQHAVALPLAQPGTDRNAAMHEARFRLNDAGDYVVTVAVVIAKSETAQAEGEVAFPVAITPVSPLVTLTLHTVLAASLVAGAWVVRMGWRVWRPAAVMQRA